MKVFRKPLIILTLLTVFYFIPFFTNAQGIGSDPCDYQDPMIPCPIDSWIIILLITGAIYGIKKVKDSRKPASK
jgi:hypothetical protein